MAENQCEFETFINLLEQIFDSLSPSTNEGVQIHQILHFCPILFNHSQLIDDINNE